MPQSVLEPALIVPDTHRPYHDKIAWKLFLKVGKALRPKILVCIGDFADFYSVSSHSKDPRRALMLEAELSDVHVGLDELDALGAREKHFTAGNHSDRLTRYLQDKAPALYSVVGIEKVLRLKERGWTYTPYKDTFTLGKMNFTHDVGAAGRNATFKALDTYQHSIITGHAHRMQYIVEGNAVGEQKLSAQFGWLGDADAVDYMHKANVYKNWALGFGIGYYHPETEVFYAVPVPIIRTPSRHYSCMVNGRYYEEQG